MLFKYYNALQNRNGDALAGYLVRLFGSAGEAIDLFSDENGTPISTESGVANAAKSDDLGMVRFYVDSGTYDLRLYDLTDTFISAEIGVPMIVGINELTLAGEDGASLVGTPTGTVQGDIDAANAGLAARPTTTALASPTGGEMVGIEGGGTLAGFFDGACYPDRFGVFDDPDHNIPGGRVDQSAALQAWLDFAQTHRLTPTCHRPIRAYTSQTLTFDPSALVSSQKIPDIRLSDLDLITTATPGLVVGSVAAVIDSARIELPSIWRYNVDWSGDISSSKRGGIVLINIRFCAVTVGTVRNFPAGVQFWSEGFGVTYNTIVGQTLIDNRFGNALVCVGADSYVNENKWFGGTVTYSDYSGDETIASAAGYFFTYSGGGYREHNNNIVQGVSFEMPAQISHPNVTEGVPVWFNGCGNSNRFMNCRAEGWRGPLMHVAGDVNGNANATVGLSNELDISFSGSVGGVNGSSSIRQVAGAYGNLLRLPGRSNEVRWHSGPLRQTLYSGGPADGARVTAPFFLREGIIITNKRELTFSNRAQTNILGVQWNNGMHFIMLDTSKVKNFEFFADVHRSFPGKWFFQALDSAGAAMSATTTDAYGTERNIKLPGATSSDLYGGGWDSGSDNPRSVRMTVREEVKRLVIGKGNGEGGGPCVLSGFGFIAYTRAEDASLNNVDGGPLLIDPLYDDETHRSANANPATAGTHGLYAKGAVINNNGATSGQPMGWICTTAGALGVTRADATSYAVLGQVVIASSKAYAVYVAGTTGTGTAPTGTTPDTDYTDGTVVFRYIGPKAAFAALANVP